MKKKKLSPDCMTCHSLDLIPDIDEDGEEEEEEDRKNRPNKGPDAVTRKAQTACLLGKPRQQPYKEQERDAFLHALLPSFLLSALAYSALCSHVVRHLSFRKQAGYRC